MVPFFFEEHLYFSSPPISASTVSEKTDDAMIVGLRSTRRSSQQLARAHAPRAEWIVRARVDNAYVLDAEDWWPKVVAAAGRGRVLGGNQKIQGHCNLGQTNTF